MRIDIDVAKIPKHGSDISGDTVDVVERRDGGLSLLLSDGMRSDAEGKFTSSLVVSKATSLIAEGTRDGAACRAAHDALYSMKNGEASASLVIVSADFAANSLVISRNSNCPVLVKKGDDLFIYQEQVSHIGTDKMIKPNIYVLEMAPDLAIIAFTDGFLKSGKGSAGWDIKDLVMEAKQDLATKRESVAVRLLDKAMARDNGRPKDDISVGVMTVSPRAAKHRIRRMVVSMPM